MSLALREALQPLDVAVDFEAPGARVGIAVECPHHRLEQHPVRHRLFQEVHRALPHRLNRQRHAVRPVAVRLAIAQPAHRQMRDRERQHRAERVDPHQEVQILWDHERGGHRSGHDDQHVRRGAVRVQAPEPARDLSIGGQRVRQSRQAQHRRVGRRHQRQRAERGDRVSHHVGQVVRPQVRDDAHHGRVHIARAEFAVTTVHRQRRHRHQRDARVQDEHRHGAASDQALERAA